MGIKRFFKGGTFVLVALFLVVALLPFAIEQVGETFEIYKFPATDWVKGLFTSQSAGMNPTPSDQNTSWTQQEADLKAFCDWADGVAGVEISIIRPEVFQIVRANRSPATEAHFSWRLELLSDTLTVDAEQVRKRLTLICDPQGKVSGQIASVTPLSGGKKGFLVTVDHVRGEGKMGLKYEDRVPVFYDVELRRIWLVPVASCRSAVKGRYDSEVFFPGVHKGLSEGKIISPSSDKCGYRILSISDHCVWFEAFYDSEPPKDTLAHGVWPDFSRVDTRHPTPLPGRLVFGRNRCFWPGDAIRLPITGDILQLDDLLKGKAAVFRLLDRGGHHSKDLLCVIVREK